MRVLLNDRALSRTLTGVGNYIAQLLLQAETHAEGVRLAPFLYTYVKRGDWRQRLRPPDPPAPAGGPQHPRDLSGSRYPWWLRSLLQSGYRWLFASVARGYDVYHEPNHIPIRCGRPTVTTIHDLSVVLHPQWHPADRVRWYEREFEQGVRQTRQFLAASEFTKGELCRHCGIGPDRVHVTYQAARAAFRPHSPEQIAETRSRLGVPERFLLFVGTLEPRKNVTGLLDAYGRLPASLRRECPLLVAGAWGWKAEQLREKLAERSLAEHVRLLGYMHDEQLACLYSACAALVWPSFYEGFGLPPLEAMACGAPVIVSNAASLPEVAGEAGILLEPNDVDAWSGAMRRVVEEPELRAELSTRGLAQAARFTWAQFVQKTCAAYEAALRM